MGFAAGRQAGGGGQGGAAAITRPHLPLPLRQGPRPGTPALQAPPRDRGPGAVFCWGPGTLTAHAVPPAAEQHPLGRAGVHVGGQGGAQAVFAVLAVTRVEHAVLGTGPSSPTRRERPPHGRPGSCRTPPRARTWGPHALRRPSWRQAPSRRVLEGQRPLLSGTRQGPALLALRPQSVSATTDFPCGLQSLVGHKPSGIVDPMPGYRAGGTDELWTSGPGRTLEKPLPRHRGQLRAERRGWWVCVTE